MWQYMQHLIASLMLTNAKTRGPHSAQVFVDMKYKDSTVNTDDQIVGLLIALLFAGQHTSSITSTWTSLLASR